MRRVTKTTAYTGAVLALALTLTGCNGSGTPGGNSTSASASQSSLEPIQDVPSSASSSSTSASSSSASASSSALPEYKPVTSKKPKNAEEGQKKAFEAVQLYYDVQVEILKGGDPRNANQLYVAAMDPYAGKRVDSLKKALEDGGHTYEGKSTPELIQATAGPLVHADGSLTDYSSVRVLVCEDNSKVKITDEKGKSADTGAERYRVEYGVRWDEQSGEWRVNAREVPKKGEKEVQPC